jgi:predicted acyl esterase
MRRSTITLAALACLLVGVSAAPALAQTNWYQNGIMRQQTLNGWSARERARQQQSQPQSQQQRQPAQQQRQQPQRQPGGSPFINN